MTYTRKTIDRSAIIDALNTITERGYYYARNDACDRELAKSDAILEARGMLIKMLGIDRHELDDGNDYGN